MRVRRTVKFLVLLALGVGMLPTTTALAAGCEFKYENQAAGSTCEGKLGWSYDRAAGTLRYGSVIASATSDDPYEYTEDFACEANTALPGNGAGCSKAFDCPPRADSEGKPMSANRIVAFRRLKADPNDPWRATTTGVCRYDGRTVPMSEVLDARRRLEKTVGKPWVIAQPPGGVTLVNFTSLFHAPPQVDTSLEIPEPVRGTITATPQYTWDLGDGITAEGAGHPYDQQFDPKNPDSDGYYVKAVYRSPGEKTIRLTLTWKVTISLDGSGAIPLAPIVLTDTSTTTAKTAAARLVAR